MLAAVCVCMHVCMHVYVLPVTITSIITVLEYNSAYRILQARHYI